MTEFSIIEEFCHGVGPDHAETSLSVGDDAAIVSVPRGMEMAISVDTMVCGVHFFADVSPSKLAHKILAVNLSDMAAMGAEPKWATMALSISRFDNAWLRAFSNTLKAIANRFNVQIVGGDTTQGPLNLSITIMGLLPKGEAIRRSGAIPGDDVYVSHYLGDAALGLAVLETKASLSDAGKAYVVSRLETPEPRVKLGQALRGVASSCLDISDGLIGDLRHICKQSDVSIHINADLVPLSEVYQSFITNSGSLDLALNGGDDYELAFTANPGQRAKIDAIANQQGVLLTRVGSVVDKDSEPLVTVSLHGEPYSVAKSYEHFS